MEQQRRETIDENTKTPGVFGLIAIIILTFLIFFNTTLNGFTNWDDPAYITDNPHIRELSPERLKDLFLTTWQTAELTLPILSFSIDYALWKLDPFPYHLENLILHLLNVMLVFFLFTSLTKHTNLVLLTTLLWAIHPFRVESVAWVAQRKDMLYGFFYLSGLLCHVRYVRNQYKLRYLALTALLFVLALLSKDAALTFVVALGLLDYYLERAWNRRVVIEKLPFLLILGIRLWNHYLMPHALAPLIMGNITSDFSFAFTLIDRFFLACYALAWYLVRLVVPVRLAVIHPFPAKNGAWLPPIYYLATVVVALLVVLLLILLKKVRPARRDVIFGVLFFAGHLAIALHLVPIGGVSVVAERYTYLAALGLCWLMSHAIRLVLKRFGENPPFAAAGIWMILTIYILFLAGTTINRNIVWHDSVTLWNDQIKKYPECAIAYNNRGIAKGSARDYPGAADDFTRAITLHPTFTAAYQNRGQAWNELGNYQNALSDLDYALTRSPNHALSYYNRGISYEGLGEYQQGLADFTRALTLNPDLVMAYNRRGVLNDRLNQYQAALADFNQALRLQPDFAEAYTNRGNTYAKLGQDDAALADFSRTIAIAPQLADAYYNRAIILIKQRQCEQASADITQLQTLLVEVPGQLLEFFQKSCQ